MRIDEREVKHNVSLNHAIHIDNMKLHRSIYLLSNSHLRFVIGYVLVGGNCIKL